MGRERGFTDGEVACLRALADIFLPQGFGLPGGADVDVASALATNARSWDPAVRLRVRVLLRTWDRSPVSAGMRRRFSEMDRSRQEEWVARCYRSRISAQRLVLTALKQLIVLTWASAEAVEDAIGYDYRCRIDDDVHGAARPVAGKPAPADPEPEPADYHRPGPAVASGAIPLRLVDRRAAAPRTAADSALTTETWPDLSDGEVIRADAVIVGSGAGGAVVSATLAEAGLEVVVLEEGPQVSAAHDFVGPMFERFQKFCRDNGTTQAWGTPPIPLPLGRVVGGTTVVNSGTCFRAPDRVLHRWEHEYGVEGAAAANMAAFFEPIEDFLHVRPVPWAVLGPNGAAAHRGAVALGMSGGPLLRNITDCHGCGQCAFGCPTDSKQAMHVSYLPRAQRAGARILSQCKVVRIEHRDGRAAGVRATLLDERRSKRGTIRVLADRVIVCAGAIGTPLLLEASGVPDPSGLTGENLRIHPATGVGGFFPGDDVSWKGTLQSYYIDSLFDTHEVMFEATSTVPSVGAGSLPGYGALAMPDLAALRTMATLGFYVSDTSKGRVRRLPGGEPLVTYQLNALDTKRMAIGVAVAAEVLLAAGATRVYPGIPGIDVLTSPADITGLKDKAVRPGHLKLTAFHPMGTVRMGSDPARSVLDPFGRHRDVAGLWVADASTFPSCVGVNPQMTIMAFASRTAAALLAEAGAAGSRTEEVAR
ncbi:MAG TPA: GMC family oxidoreductase [Actinomycetota bacterium]|nr:GMC family oxidoreductase [Actinomycetota bacterium]